MRRTQAGWLAFACLFPVVAEASAALDCSSRGVEIRVPPSEEVEVHANPGPAAWLEIEEEGTEIEIGGAVAGFVEVTVPPRYGRFLVPVSHASTLGLSRRDAASSPAAVKLTLRCEASASDRSRIDWYRRAATLSARLAPVYDGKTIDAVMAEASELERSPPDAAAAALVAHLRAQALYVANRTSESTAAFGEAQVAWRRAGDPSRALAALVGKLEDLNRAGRYREALAAAVVPRDILPTDAYFANRVMFSRCLADKYLGRLHEAAACYERGIAWQQEQGERAEVAGLKIALADILRDLGRNDAAEHEARRGYDMAAGPDAPRLRGRAQLLLYDILLDSGRIADALEQIEQSLGEFKQAHATRWEANAMLKAAWMYAQFGALDEAAAFIDDALPLLSERDAPARVAAALSVKAEIESLGGDNALALDDARKAEAIYERLGMPIELEECRLQIAGLELDAGRFDEARAVLDAMDDSRKAGIARRLLQARLALDRNKVGRAASLLAAMPQQAMTLRQALAKGRLKALLLARMGRIRDALRALREEAYAIRSNAASARNPLLADLLIRQLAPLRSLAVELVGGRYDDRRGDLPLSDGERQAEVWRWLVMSRSPRPAALAGAADAMTRFDAAAIRELLADPLRARPDSSAPRRLLGLLALQGAPSSEPADATLDDLQSKLDDHAVFVAFLDGDSLGMSLWATRSQAWLVPVAGARELRSHKQRLLKALESPASTLDSVADAADTLAADLLWNVPVATQPRMLWVDSGSELADVPWSVLRWRGSAGALIDETSVSVVQLQPSCCAHAHATVSGHVFVGGASKVDALPELPQAMAEAKLIAAAVDGSGIQFVPEHASGKDAVFDVLGERGAWVHFAAHGQADPRRIGYNGIFLRGESAEQGFLSGIDVLAHDVASELVVLGTCQSARRTGSLTSALSFADAMSRSGADNVVAALWPISDSAAAIWVPHFYRDAAFGGSGFPEALRKAQLRLRESRRYRHPYYWASLVHLSHLDVARQAAAVSTTAAHDRKRGE